MKTEILISGIALFLGAGLAFADTSEPLIITNFQYVGDQATLQWTGGRANYQVQTRADLNSPWTNLGSPTASLSALVPITGQQAFFRVVSDYTAQYQVVFNATWSQQTHPFNWTTNAHWSGLVGGVHNSGTNFFRDGTLASEGIRLMSELGQKPQLLAEVGGAITNGTALFQLSGGGIRPSPGTVSLTFPQPMTRDYPLVTLCSMIAPSPCWFVGVDSLNMISNGSWRTNVVITLYGMDAGTQTSNMTYEGPYTVNSPHVPTILMTGFPALQNGVIVPFGTFTFTRLD
jgi:hypothetical protein